jgi:hypothetical protein
VSDAEGTAENTADKTSSAAIDLARTWAAQDPDAETRSELTALVHLAEAGDTSASLLAPPDSVASSERVLTG